MNERERWSVANFAHYFDDLDLSDIAIPPAFWPLTAKIPDSLSDQEVAVFIQKFNGLSRRTDRKKYNSVERELVSRTAGIHYWDAATIDGQIRPLGMDNEEFVQRKCNHHRAIGKIFPQGRDQKGEHQRRKNLALSFLWEKSASSFSLETGEAGYVSDVLQAGRLCPNQESDSILNAIIWAEQLDQMDRAALHELAAKHFEQSGSISKTKYKPDPNNTNRETNFERFMHYQLAKRIWRLADSRKQEK